MKVLITGGAGFLGQELCKTLLADDFSGFSHETSTTERLSEVVLFDAPGAFDSLGNGPICSDRRVRCVTGSIDDASEMARLIDTPAMSVFHLACIEDTHGEQDFDLCMCVNLDGTRNVLEACRAQAQADGRLVRFVYASSGVTFGESTENPVLDDTKQVPMSTCGVTKAMCEMLVNDYTRKRFVDGRSARLPAVIVRPGGSAMESISCFSDVVWKPLRGLDVVLPVARELPHACSSLRALVKNLHILHNVAMGKPGEKPVDRAVSLPSIPLTLQALIDGLHRVVPADQHHKLGKISDAIDPVMSGAIGRSAMKEMSHRLALSLGMIEVPDVDTIIREYLEDNGTCGVIEAPSNGWMNLEPPGKRRKIETASASPKVAVVTGAGAGIGRATALALSQSVFNCVVLVGRRKEPLEQTLALIRKTSSVEVLTVSCDVTRPADVHHLFLTVERTFGRCDLLFNNAGVGLPPTPIDEVAPDAWKRCVDTNLTGSFLCIHEAFKLMKKQSPRGGRIINNGSVSADRPRPLSAAYTASKHAITGLTKCVSLDGRAFDIACGQIDIGNALSDMSGYIAKGALQATIDGSERRVEEPMMHVTDVARSVVHMASLPLEANVQFMTVMATKMPLIGRG